MIVPPTGIPPLTARTRRQHDHILSLKHNLQTFVLGPPGTGKTYVSAAYAANLLSSGKVEKIILTRPSEGAGENYGFLPGKLEQKIAPVMRPVQTILEQRLGKANVEKLLKDGVIVFEPFQYMLGKTFDNAFVILDEAQNTTVTQLKMLLTRMGENTRLVVDGDIRQTYIRSESGLGYILDRIKANQLFEQGIGLVEYTPDDVVRGPITKMWVTVFEKDHAR